MPAPAQDVPGVIARLEAIIGACPPGDGVGWFARVYLQVTRTVAQAMQGRTFHDPRYLGRLDVVFANLFFAAHDDAARRPPAWRPLFAARARHDVHPIQFAIAGMNAHINRDLPVALVATCRELRLGMADGSPEHADYLAVNGLLAQAERQLKHWFTTGILGEVDALTGPVDDRLAMWDVERARDFAWVQGATLWALRDLPPLRASFLDGLDHMVGMAGRGLLLPLP